jgi:hypothetical protein
MDSRSKKKTYAIFLSEPEVQVLDALLHDTQVPHTLEWVRTEVNRKIRNLVGALKRRKEKEML